MSQTIIENRRAYESAADALRDYVVLTGWGQVVFRFGEEGVKFFGWVIRVSRNRVLVQWAPTPFHDVRTYFTLIPINQIDLETLYYWPPSAGVKGASLVPEISGSPPRHVAHRLDFPREKDTKTEEKWEARVEKTLEMEGGRL